MNKGWLVNDCLTCIPNTKTFWHDLLEHIEGLEDKTFGYTHFHKLARKIEKQLMWRYFLNKKPNYIIRNATFFRPIKTKIPQICLLQDYYDAERLQKEQLPVIDSCAVTVVNSPYVYAQVKDTLKNHVVKMIPMGVDFDYFDPNQPLDTDVEVLPDSILFIGAATIWPKGFDMLMEFVEKTNYNFTFVMKDDFSINHPRIKVFNRIDQIKLKAIMEKCRMGICTSQTETFHLAGMECCAMNLPVAATHVGIYTSLLDGGWGMKYDKNNMCEIIDYIYNNIDIFSPRQTILDLHLDKNACMQAWNELIIELLDKNKVS